MTHSAKVGIRGSFSLSTLEIKILNILWTTGADTVKQIHDEILRAEIHGKFQELTPYTTVMSTMNTLSARGVLKRDKSGHTHYYKTVYTREEIKAEMVKAVNEALWYNEH